MAAKLMENTVWGIVSAAVAGVLATVLGFWINLRKGKVEESTTILAEWREVVGEHKNAMKELRQELSVERKEHSATRAEYAATRAENAGLRERLAVAEAEVAACKVEISHLSDTIAGLRRDFAQTGQSTFRILNDKVVNPPKAVPIVDDGNLDLSGPLENLNKMN